MYNQRYGYGGGGTYGGGTYGGPPFAAGQQGYGGRPYDVPMQYGQGPGYGQVCIPTATPFGPPFTAIRCSLSEGFD
jgi:hypothetical protein